MDRNLPTSISDLGLNDQYINVPRIIHGNLTSLNLGERIEYVKLDLENARYLTREDAFNSLWNALRLQNIHLRNLAVPFEITDALLEYIASYSGLESFALKGHRDWSLSGCDNFAPQFYKHALPMHKNTLTRSEDEWCVGLENVEDFAIMKKLRFLLVGVHSRGLDPDPLELPKHSIFRKDSHLPNSVLDKSFYCDRRS
ncbi:hypothetical protein F5050DRAFT_103206 [Lentinula boryana]|uniref:Uncharacterized protein n=1 Tax=Lentinula boryana TaxID=40481 RepID=A0ABQ8QD45_9AGAR|nr:hypothetical protein F5050DRAFT_103206 [Lentinula boryana]